MLGLAVRPALSATLRTKDLIEGLAVKALMVRQASGKRLNPRLARRKLAVQFCITPFALWALIAGSAYADDKDIHEDEVKAAFVYNFAKFVEWPKDGIHGQINLCILGESPLGFSALKAIDGRTAQDKQLVTKLLNKPDDLNGCQIVFIAASEQNKMAQLLKLAHRQHALTVGDVDGFSKGGAIGLVKTDEKIRFEINLLAAKEAGLTVSSRLLSLALTVYDEHNKPEQ
ncbi:MAG: YfiR family protein [Methylobacter sp.]